MNKNLNSFRTYKMKLEFNLRNNPKDKLQYINTISKYVILGNALKMRNQILKSLLSNLRS